MRRAIVENDGPARHVLLPISQLDVFPKSTTIVYPIIYHQHQPGRQKDSQWLHH